MVTALDLFAGPGGWDLACKWLGIEVDGIELDDAACDTRKAANLSTIQADIAEISLRLPVGEGRVPAPRWPLGYNGLIASPPCPSFSVAGNGKGRAQFAEITWAVNLMYAQYAQGAHLIRVPNLAWTDPRTPLVLEPLRFVLEAKLAGAAPYRWLAFEQVPTVLRIWEKLAGVFRTLGYSVWTGQLHSETFGVPQTRKRAVLIASLDHEVSAPRATHSRYYPRNPAKLDPGVLKWVSMFEALHCESGVSMRSNYGTGGDASERQPAPAVTSKINRNMWVSNDRQPHSANRSTDEPAPTITGGHDHQNRVWLRNNNTANAAVRPEDEPSGTLYFGGRLNAVTWETVRPSTTVNGDPRISRPGRHDPEESGSQQRDSVRVTEAEAGVLQSFPRDYPWQGTKTKRFQQIGNAIPPLMARAILKAAIGAEYVETC